MASTARLYDLQALDLEIAAKSQTLQDVEGRLGESAALREAREALAAAQGVLKEAESHRRDLEMELEDMSARLAPLEKKLYGGSVRIPKELVDLQSEVSHLKSLTGQREDTLLESMEAADAARQRVKAAEAALAEAEAAWRQEQAELQRQQRALGAELEALQAQRQERAAALDPRSLRLYEDLRAVKQGRAVAMVARGVCQVCRVSLSMTEVQRARSGTETVTCSSCGRILHVA
ncbi:MAG: hypothetical protein HY330_00500 [Chloroflexi bacterium]|nr:hypothetical protein [Chloroflexota bacterium]